MLWGCKMLRDISPLKDWNINDEDIIICMFFRCSSDLDIQPVKIWDITKNKF